MNKAEKRDQIVAAVSTALLVVALIGMVIIHDSNRSLEDMLNGARLTNESILSEKLSLDKDIRNFKNQLTSLHSKNKQLDKQLADANTLIAGKEKELKYASPARTRSLEKELGDMKRMRSQLEKQIADLNTQMKSLEGTNNDLNSQLVSLSAKNKELTANNELMKAFAANNYRVETSRGKNEKLTVVAKRTKRLKVGFDLPQTVVEKIEFKIKTPDGKVIDKEEDGLSSVILDAEDGSDLMVSLEPLGDFEVTKRIEMRYEPKKKLSKGVYTIDIYNGNTYMVSCQVKLR